MSPSSRSAPASRKKQLSTAGSALTALPGASGVRCSRSMSLEGVISFLLRELLTAELLLRLSLFLVLLEWLLLRLPREANLPVVDLLLRLDPRVSCKSFLMSFAPLVALDEAPSVAPRLCPDAKLATPRLVAISETVSDASTICATLAAVFCSRRRRASDRTSSSDVPVGRCRYSETTKAAAAAVRPSIFLPLLGLLPTTMLMRRLNFSGPRALLVPPEANSILWTRVL